MGEIEKDLTARYGNVALVTGASAGIGKAYAYRLAQEGFNLILVARREKQLIDIKAEISEKFGVDVLVVPADLSKPHACDLVEASVNQAGWEVSLLVNNAGFGTFTEFGEASRERELASIDLNCRAVVDLTHRFLAPMKKAQRGAVIIISSVLSQVPTPYYATYSATKAFDLLFGEALYEEMRPRNIDVLTVLPTLTATEFQDVSGMTNVTGVSPRTPEQVVNTSINALGKKPVVADSFSAKLMLLLIRFIPRALVGRISCFIMNSSTSRRKKN